MGQGTDAGTREVLLGNSPSSGDAGSLACGATKASTRSARLELALGET